MNVDANSGQCMHVLIIASMILRLYDADTRQGFMTKKERLVLCFAGMPMKGSMIDRISVSPPWSARSQPWYSPTFEPD